VLVVGLIAMLARPWIGGGGPPSPPSTLPPSLPPVGVNPDPFVEPQPQATIAATTTTSSKAPLDERRAVLTILAQCGVRDGIMSLIRARLMRLIIERSIDPFSRKNRKNCQSSVWPEL
jgi:hypothetical protein